MCFSGKVFKGGDGNLATTDLEPKSEKRCSIRKHQAFILSTVRTQIEGGRTSLIPRRKV